MNSPTVQDAFFQPYLPLQQLDMIKESKSWLCGTTNSIVGQQHEVDLFVDVSPVDYDEDYCVINAAGC